MTVTLPESPLATPPVPPIVSVGLFVSVLSLGAARLRAGRLVLTDHVWLAGELALPAWSMARTWNVCEPLLSPE